MVSQALRDALDTATHQLATERRAIETLRAMGQTPETFDLKFALSEEKRLAALVARIEQRIRAEAENRRRIARLIVRCANRVEALSDSIAEAYEADYGFDCGEFSNHWGTFVAESDRIAQRLGFASALLAFQTAQAIGLPIYDETTACYRSLQSRANFFGAAFPEVGIFPEAR